MLTPNLLAQYLLHGSVAVLALMALLYFLKLLGNRFRVAAAYILHGESEVDLYLGAGVFIIIVFVGKLMVVQTGTGSKNPYHNATLETISTERPALQPDLPPLFAAPPSQEKPPMRTVQWEQHNPKKGKKHKQM